MYTLKEYENWYRKRYRRTSSALTAFFIIIADMLAIMLSIGIGFFFVRITYGSINFKSFVTYWPYLPAFIVMFSFFYLYPGASIAPAEELRRITGASLIVHTGIILSRSIYYLNYDTVSTGMAISFVFSMLVILIGRTLMRNFLSASGLGGIPAVIYGAGYTGKAVVDKLLSNKNAGYIPVLILDDDKEKGSQYHGIPIIHDTGLGPEIVKSLKIKMAIVAMPSLSQKETKNILINSVMAFRYNVLIPDIFSVTNIWMSVRDFGGILGFVTSNKLNMFWNLWIKRLMDISIVTLGAIILSPLLICLAILVKITSPGPVLYSQERIGQRGNRFKAYKFRSMVIDADIKLKQLLAKDSNAKEEWEKNQKLKNDPRITIIGKFMRKTSLDEVPQFINIFKGEMSLVGPRPIVTNEIKKYGDDYERIFSVKPGLTGLWQVSGRSDTNYADRVSFDTYYLQSWSVWLDLWIIYKTIGVVLQRRGAY
jgi:Undecaprenyl-phosphate galactose phosphotransferase WbaP